MTTPSKPTPFLQRRKGEESYDERRLPIGMAASREATLAQWLGPERTADVFADLRPLQEIAPLLDGIMDTYADQELALLHRLKDSWTTLFGTAIASQCQPLNIFNGVLKIEVNNATCMYVFQRQRKADFLKLLQDFSGGDRLKDIQFVAQGVRRRFPPVKPGEASR